METENKFIKIFKKIADVESSFKRMPLYFLIMCILLVVLIVKLDKTNDYLQMIAENGATKLEVETQDDTFIEIITEKDKTKEDYVPQLEVVTEKSTESTTKKNSSTNSTATTTQLTDENVSRKTYILNTSSKKIHSPSCSFVSRTKDENKKTVKLSSDELKNYIDKGYAICKTCGGK